MNIPKTNKVIAICGDSATGKSRLANILGLLLYPSTILECDRYHKWERHDEHWKSMTQLNPEANNLALLEKDIIALKNGEWIRTREYDHHTGTFTREFSLEPSPYLIVCGLHTLMCDLSLFDLTIFLDTDTVLKRADKIKRDIRDRGYSIEQITEQLRSRSGEYEKYILPLMNRADVIVKRDTTSLTVRVQNQRPDMQHVIDILREDER